jgi:hypothetical protein
MKMYGYTIADAASPEVFSEASDFIVDRLHFLPLSNRTEDVFGNISQKFEKEGETIQLESDTDIDYVAILSSSKLPITALSEWTQ